MRALLCALALTCCASAALEDLLDSDGEPMVAKLNNGKYYVSREDGRTYTNRTAAEWTSVFAGIVDSGISLVDGTKVAKSDIAVATSWEMRLWDIHCSHGELRRPFGRETSCGIISQAAANRQQYSNGVPVPGQFVVPHKGWSHSGGGYRLFYDYKAKLATVDVVSGTTSARWGNEEHPTKPESTQWYEGNTGTRGVQISKSGQSTPPPSWSPDLSRFGSRMPAIMDTYKGRDGYSWKTGGIPDRWWAETGATPGQGKRVQWCCKTESPTQAPTKSPTQAPTQAPTKSPTKSPTPEPYTPSSAAVTSTLEFKDAEGTGGNGAKIAQLKDGTMRIDLDDSSKCVEANICGLGDHSYSSSVSSLIADMAEVKANLSSIGALETRLAKLEAQMANLTAG